MRRGPFFFLLSLFIVLLCLELWIIFPEFGSDEIASIVVAPSRVDTAAARNAAQKDTSLTLRAQPPESFAYIGLVKASTLIDPKKKTPGSAESAKKRLPAGQNRVAEGEIPELTIEIGDWDIKTVADHLGFVLVAATEKKILGRIGGDAFMPISRSELSRFSTRARSAETIGNYVEVRDRIAQRFELSTSEIRLMFLVPLQVEQQFVNAQRRILGELSVPSDQVALMRGFYDSNFNVRLTEVITKDGKTIDIH
jgi:hypothetical protein